MVRQEGRTTLEQTEQSTWEACRDRCRQTLGTTTDQSRCQSVHRIRCVRSLGSRRVHSINQVMFLHPTEAKHSWRISPRTLHRMVSRCSLMLCSINDLVQIHRLHVRHTKSIPQTDSRPSQNLRLFKLGLVSSILGGAPSTVIRPGDAMTLLQLTMTTSPRRTPCGKSRVKTMLSQWMCRPRTATMIF